MSTPYAKLPAWADYGLIPLINLLVAFLVAGLVVLIVGENPLRAAAILVDVFAHARPPHGMPACLCGRLFISRV